MTTTTRTILLASTMLAGLAAAATDDAQAGPRHQFGGMSGRSFAPRMAPRQSFAPIGNRAAQLPHFNQRMALPRPARDPRVNGGARPSFTRNSVAATPNTVPAGPMPRSAWTQIPGPHGWAPAPRGQRRLNDPRELGNRLSNDLPQTGSGGYPRISPGNINGNITPPGMRAPIGPHATLQPKPPVPPAVPNLGPRPWLPYAPAPRANINPASPVPLTVPGLRPQLPAGAEPPAAPSRVPPGVGAPNTPPGAANVPSGSLGGQGFNRPGAGMKGRPEINVNPQVLNPEWQDIANAMKMFRGGRLAVPAVVPNHRGEGGPGARDLVPGMNYPPGVRVFGSDGTESTSQGGNEYGDPVFPDPNGRTERGNSPAGYPMPGSRQHGPRHIGGVPTPFGNPNSQAGQDTPGSNEVHFRMSRNSDMSYSVTTTESRPASGSETHSVSTTTRYDRNGNVTGQTVEDVQRYREDNDSGGGDEVMVVSSQTTDANGRVIKSGTELTVYSTDANNRPIGGPSDSQPAGDEYSGRGGGIVCMNDADCRAQMDRLQRERRRTPAPGGMPTGEEVHGSSPTHAGPGTGAVTDPSPMDDGTGGGGSPPPDPCSLAPDRCGGSGSGGAGGSEGPGGMGGPGAAARIEGSIHAPAAARP